MLASKAMLSPSTTMPAANRPMWSLASRCRRSRTSKALSSELPDRADRAAVGAHHSAFRLQDGQVLADRHGRDAELQRQICDTRAAVLLDEAADVLLAFAREDFGSPIGRSIQRSLLEQ